MLYLHMLLELKPALYSISRFQWSEKSGKFDFLQGQGKVREFHFG